MILLVFLLPLCKQNRIKSQQFISFVAKYHYHFFEECGIQNGKGKQIISYSCFSLVTTLKTREYRTKPSYLPVASVSVENNTTAQSAAKADSTRKRPVFLLTMAGLWMLGMSLELLYIHFAGKLDQAHWIMSQNDKHCWGSRGVC